MIDGMHSALDAIATQAEDVGIDDVFVNDRIAIRPGSSTVSNSKVLSTLEWRPVILSSSDDQIINSNNNRPNLHIESLIEGSMTFIEVY